MTDHNSPNSLSPEDSPRGAGDWLPDMYAELRNLAAAQLASEPPGQTLQPTALVHEAYMRLLGKQQFVNRAHFFVSAAIAMRRILIDIARRKRTLKHGGNLQRVELIDIPMLPDSRLDRLIALDESLTRYATVDPDTARLIEVHYFTGLSIPEAAKMLNVSRSSAYRDIRFGMAWLQADMKSHESISGIVPDF